MSDGTPPGRPGESAADAALQDHRWRRLRRAALIAWAVLVVVVWNVVFDAVVIQAGRDYLTRQALHQEGRGPAVTIPDVMRPGITRGLWTASLGAGAVAALGALGFWAAGRKRRRGAPAGTAT